MMLLILPIWADDGMFEETIENPSDPFFMPSSMQTTDPVNSQSKPRSSEKVDNSKSIPPLKLLRLKIKEKSIQRQNAKKAPRHGTLGDYKGQKNPFPIKLLSER